MKRTILLWVLLSSLFFNAYSQYQSDPVTWSFKLVDKGNGEVELVGTAIIAPNWHLYDINIPEGGPNATELTIDELKGATKVGKFKVIDSKLISAYDATFKMNLGYYANKAVFAQRLKVTDKKAFKLEGDIRAQACDDEECTPPLPNSFEFSTKDLPATLTVADKPIEAVKGTTIETAKDAAAIATDVIEATALIPADTLVAAGVAVIEPKADIALGISALWTPVIDELETFGAAGSISNMSFLWIFIWGMIGGFIALLTPCVWPLIPMTVSFFLKRNKADKKKALKDAITYGLAIIIIYVALGLVITGLFGASALNELSTSAVFNLLFTALLVFFAISFLGAFEITLPASWSNKIDSKADSTTGLISIFFMAFTLALVSFSCTGPIIGTLLVEAASSGAILAPAIGMFGFALALAIPFSLFALFPSWLQSMPKSGGWLNSVKVVLGFLELALALKFFSVADLAYGWGLLDREVFLVLWIVIFVLLGFYLLGKLKFAHDSDLKHVSVSRLFLAIIPLSFAMYLVPGLWGAPLKNISAFAPPLWTQDFNLYEGVVHAHTEDYEVGMEMAKRLDKPVIIDFSGYGCVNCRKMEASVWTDPNVKSILEEQYILITLMVDDKTRLPETIEVTERDGKKSKLKTIGDKWSYLQRHKFATNSQPYYVLLNHDGSPIARSYAYDEDISKYISFLNDGLANYKKWKEGEPLK